MRIWLAALVLGLSVTTVQASIVQEKINYGTVDHPLEGVLVHETSLKGKLPGVMIVHQWMGITDYELGRAQQLTKLGYVVFVADIYGKGIHPQSTTEAGAQASIYRQNRPLMRQRAQAGLTVLQNSPYVDAKRTVIMGYCFGGGVALELARSGAPVAGTVSFHGNLDTPSTQDAKAIKGEVLVLHGADDPYVTFDQVAAFRAEMQAANVVWSMVLYGQAVHAFSQPNAGSDNSKGTAYNAKADQESWVMLTQFLKRVVGK